MKLSELVIAVIIFAIVIFASTSVYVSMAENYDTAEVPDELEDLSTYSEESISNIQSFTDEQRESLTTESKTIPEEIWEQGSALFGLATGTIMTVLVTIPTALLSIMGIGATVFSIDMVYIYAGLSIIGIIIVFGILSILTKVEA